MKSETQAEDKEILRDNPVPGQSLRVTGASASSGVRLGRGSLPQEGGQEASLLLLSPAFCGLDDAHFIGRRGVLRSH